MLLRSGKRKAEQPLKTNPLAKRQKIQKKEDLYINTGIADHLTKLFRVGPSRANIIIEERNKKPFTSQSDLIDRVSFITEESIEYSPAVIIYKSKYELERDEIFKTLMDTNVFAKHSTDTILIIAEFAIGKIEKCHNIKCEEDILMTNGHQIQMELTQYRKQNGYECGYIRCLPYEPTCIYVDPLGRMKSYYFRNSKLFGTSLYCDKCVNKLQNCRCDAGLKYFMGDDDRLVNCVRIGNICECKWKYEERKEFKQKFIKDVLPNIMYIFCPCSRHTKYERYNQLFNDGKGFDLDDKCMQEI